MVKAKRRVPMLSDAAEARLPKQIAKDPDNLEWTEEDSARAKPASEVLHPALYTALARPRGRPKAAETKQEIKLRLDRKAVEAFKRSGPGWQTRMNEAIVKAARALVHVSPTGRKAGSSIETLGRETTKTDGIGNEPPKRTSSSR